MGDAKTSSTPKTHSGKPDLADDSHAGSPMSTAASTHCSTSPLQTQGVHLQASKGRVADSWQCTPMSLASKAIAFVSEEGLCNLCIDERVEARRQKASPSSMLSTNSV